jgi:outer membrane biosynthesis protein TonB
VVIKRYQVILLSISLLPISAFAADNQCLDKTCVDVFTQDNQLIITAQKGAGKPVAASKKPVVKPKPAIPKPVAPKPVAPKPVAPKPVAPKPVAPKPKVATKPVPKPTVKPVRKVATKPATVSLSDRLIKLLPVGDINFQPESDGLVNVPVYFWLFM